MERGAAVGVVCDPKFSSMRGNDGTTDRKAKPQAFRLCSEERLKELFQLFPPECCRPDH